MSVSASDQKDEVSAICIVDRQAWVAYKDGSLHLRDTQTGEITQYVDLVSSSANYATSASNSETPTSSPQLSPSQGRHSSSTSAHPSPIRFTAPAAPHNRRRYQSNRFYVTQIQHQGVKVWCGCSDGGVRAFSAIDAQYLHASMDHPSRVSCLCATPLSVSEGLDGSVQRDDHTTSGDGSNSGGNEYGWGQAVGYGRHGRRNHSDTNNNNDSDASHHDSKTHTKESIQKGLWSVCRGSRTIVRRDPKSGNIIQRLTGHQSSVLCMAVTFASFKDTDSAAAAMSRGGSRANSRRNSRRNSRSDINTNAVMDERDPNGSCIRLWTGAEDGIRVWSLSGHCLSILRNESSPASSRVGYLLSVPIAASVSGRSVARGDGAKGSRRRSVSYRIWSSGNDGIYIWDVDSAKVCNKIPSDRSMVSGCVMGTNAWCIDKHSTVSIWNTSTCDLRQSFTVSKTPVLCVQAVEVASSVWFGTDSAIVRYTDTADGQGSIRRPKKATLLHPAQHSNGSGLENIQTEQNHTASDDRKQTHIYTSASTHSNNNRDSHNNNNNADHDNDIDDSTYANTANNDSKDNTDSHSTFGQRLSASASEEALTREIRVQTRTIGDLLREKAELQRSVEVLTSKLILRASGRKEAAESLEKQSSDTAKLRAMNETLQSSAADRIKEIERLKLSSHTMSEEIESVREELIGFQQRLQKSEREKEALRQSLEEVQEKHRSETLEANNHIDRVGAELTKLQRRMQTMAKEKRELTTQLENQSVSIQRVLQKRGGASGKGHQSMLTLEKLAFQNKIVTLEGTCRRLNEEHQDAQSQLREKEAELNELRQQHQMATEALQKERKKTVNNGSKSSGRDHAAGEAMTKKRENNLQRENAKLIERLAILQDKLKSSPVPASSSAAASSSLPKNHSSLNHNEDARNFRDSYRQQRKELNRIKERHNSAQEKLAKAEETIVQLTRSMDTMTAEKTESEGGCAQHLKSLAEAVISLRTERAKAQQEKQEREMLEMKFKSEMGVVELELKALQSKCEELQQSNEHATNELINFGNKKAELEELSQHASKKIEELLKKNQTLHARSEKMKQENTKKHKRTEARLNKAIKTLTKQLDGERSRANAIEESSLRFRQNLKNLSNEARELENSYERARAELETQAEEIGELTAMKEKRDFAREAAEKDAGNLKASVEELTNTNLALKKDITALSEELHAQRKAVREIKSEFDAERRELVKAKAAAEKGYKDAEDALSDRLEELRQTNQALKEKESAASDTIDELRRKHNDDYSEKETDIDKLRDFIRSLEDKIEKDGVVYHDIDRKVHKLEKEKSQAEEALKESEAACQDLETAMENQAEANQHLEAQLQPLVNIKDMLSNQQSRFVRVVSKLCMELKALSGRAPETEALQQTQMHAESKRSKDAAGKRNGSSTVQERSSQKDVARALLEFQQELGTVKTAFLELKTTTTALSAKRVGDSDTISVLESTKKSLRDSIADLQSINRSQSEQIDTLSLENADLTTDLENRNRELGRVKTLYQQSKESVQRDQSQFELTMSLLNQHKEELEVRASTVQRSLDEVHGQLQNATQRNKALAIKNGELTTQLEEIKVVNGVHDKTRQELQESVDHFATKTEALETELRHRMEELSHREASFHSIKNECLLLSEANEDLKATVEEQDMSLKQLEAELEETARRLETHRVSESKARTSMEIIREGIAKQLRVLEVMPDVLPPIGSEKDASGNSDMVDDHPDSEEKYGVDSEFNSGRDGGGGTTAATTSGRSKQQWALIPTNQDTTTAIATMTSSEVSFHSNRLGAAIKKLRQDKHDLEWVVRRSEAVRHKAESRNIKLIDDLDSLSVEYRQAKNDFADMAQGHQELQLQLEERSRDLALVERKMESLVASERRISDQALDVEQERSAMALEVQRKKEDVTRMENQVSMLKFQVTEGEEQLKKQSRSFEELKDVMTRRLDQVIEEKLELERRVAHATKELKAKVTFTAKIEEELRYSNNEIVRHEKQCAEYTTAINSAKADLRKEATRVKVLEDVNASLESSHNELKVEKAALIDLTEKQEDAMASIKAKNMELRRCVSNLEADAQTKAQTLRELQEEKKTLNTCLDTSRKQHNQDIAQYKTELSTVARDYTEVQRLQQTRIEQLEEERAVMELDLRSSISGSEDLKSSKEELSAQLHSATEQLSSCKRRLDVLETAYETERTKHAMTDAKSKESESKCVSLEQQVKKLLSSNKLLGEDLGKCSTELAEAKRQLTSYSIIIRDLNDDVDNQSDELQETRAAIDELTIDLKRTNEEYATKLDHSENQLERAVRESTTRISGLEDQLATATEKGVVLESRLDTQQAKYDKSIAQCMERMEEQRNEAEEMIENLNLEKMEMMTAMHEREAEVSKLRDNMDRLKSDLKNEEKRLAESAQHMTDVENDMSKYIKQTESQESIIEQLRETITQLQSAVSSTKHALTERDVTLVNTKHELQEHRREIAELKHTIADHSSTVQSLTQDKQSLEVALDEVRSQHVSVSKQHKHALAQQGDAYAALQETLQARVDTLEHDIEKLHSQVEEKTSKIDQVKATLSSSETKVRSLTEDLNRSKATCADLERQLLSLQTQQKVGKAENNELRQTKAMLENQMKQMRQATRTAEASLSSLQEKLSQAEHRRQKEQKEQKSVFTELQVSLESQITKLQTENLELRKTTTESAQVLHRIKEEKAASQEALNSVAAQMETCSARVESLERELQSCKRQGDNDEMALNEMEKTKRRLDDTIKELSRAKDMLEDQIERQAVQVSALTEDKTSLQATVMALEATAEKNAFDRDAMTKTVHKLQQSCDNARSTVAQREQQLALLGEDVKALRQEGVDHFSEKQRFEQENRMLVDRMHQLESDNKVSLQTYQSTIEALQQDKARLESACQERQSQITGMQEKIAVVDNFELTRAKLQDNIRQKEAEVRKLLLEKSEMAQLASRAVSQEETLSKRVHTLERLKQEAMEAMTQSEDRQRELQQAYDSLTQTHGAMLQNKASELAELSTAHQSKLRQLEQKVSATTTELRLEREELQQSHSVLSSRMQELVLLRDEKQKLTTKTTELTRDLQKAQDALRVSEDEYQRAFSTEKTHLTQRAAQAELRVSQLEKRVEDVTAEASVSVQQLQKALSDAHAKQESDQTMLQTYRVKVEESQRLHASDQERSAHQQMQEEELQGKLADSKRRQQRLSDEYTSYKTTMEGKIAQDRDTFNHLQLQVRALEQNAAAAAAVAAEFERQGDEENHVLRLNQERVVTARMELQAYRTASEADIARLKALLLRAQTKLDRSVEMYLAASANDSDDDDDSADAAEVHTRTRMIEQSVGHLVSRQALVSDASRRLRTLKPYLGLDIMADPPHGMKIVGVKKGSPAQASGLLPGDIVQETNSTKTCTGSQFYKILATTRPGDSLSFHLLRYQAEAVSSPSSSSSSSAVSDSPYKFARSHHVTVEVASSTLSFEQVQRLRRISEGIVLCDEQTDDRAFLQALQASKGE